jgi:hypothetical protein
MNRIEITLGPPPSSKQGDIGIVKPKYRLAQHNGLILLNWAILLFTCIGHWSFHKYLILGLFDANMHAFMGTGY